MKLILTGRFQLTIQENKSKSLSEFNPYALADIATVYEIPNKYFAEGDITYDLIEILQRQTHWSKEELFRRLSLEIEKLVTNISIDLASRLVNSEGLQEAMVEQVTKAVAQEMNRLSRR